MTKRGRPRWQYLLLFLSFLSITLAASPTSFCKCTCFTNSTIIPLDDTTSTHKPTADDSKAPAKSRRTCNDCNKQFCLDYHLPICQDATEADVFTTCFQRDSRKDEAVVFIFIFATGGLLAWAAVRPWVQKWRENARGGQTYAPVSGEDGGSR
ncbi:hypothetical protein LTR02_014160 [Friedmanniomyces endolithicus]|nr:hypothetical protein LTR94_020307 [Friedmanniomyces endolithicus]KAK0773937.1 hypothetical protein LTR38_016391 [Friedmanniomyces endolithicus]KAK0791817.1 hypothetical protein LTR59_008753 [Friedmanniomyces endolithicus]KAK0797594.1 hypothetical protein LTR75_009778 [Friedmanniomyces endolithicus]KAK0826933.1 hypothetical protein LTR03_017015 [Friedmanniomyces endolithicus]